MPSSINTFLSSFKRDLARPSRFEVQFNVPQVIQNASNIANIAAFSSALIGGDSAALREQNKVNLTLKCENAQLPSRTLMTTDQKIYGFSEKYPYETSYNDAEFVFIVSDDMGEKVLFDMWLNLVSPKSSYNVNYKETYVTDINVIQFDLYNRPTYNVVLRKAFPIVVNQLDLDWSSDSFHKLTVVFAYSDWIVGPASQYNTGATTTAI
jgi:hypothetical protein